MAFSPTAGRKDTLKHNRRPKMITARETVKRICETLSAAMARQQERLLRIAYISSYSRQILDRLARNFIVVLSVRNFEGS